MALKDTVSIVDWNFQQYICVGNKCIFYRKLEKMYNEFIICTLHSILIGRKSKEDKMVGICSKRG